MVADIYIRTKLRFIVVLLHFVKNASLDSVLEEKYTLLKLFLKTFKYQCLEKKSTRSDKQWLYNFLAK